MADMQTLEIKFSDAVDIPRLVKDALREAVDDNPDLSDEELGRSIREFLADG